jgi:TusA-related sulfurtransferase
MREREMSQEPERELELDCMGALCPAPIIQLGKAVKTLSVGETILLKADDPATESDIAAWARLTGNSVATISKHVYRVTKK